MHESNNVDSLVTCMKVIMLGGGVCGLHDPSLRKKKKRNSGMPPGVLRLGQFVCCKETVKVCGLSSALLVLLAGER